ncbi:MAG: response regulator [Thiohalocapsa sp.]|jgi:DNA-binding response OmpR family regulator|uniref:response regulator n=1 Tax=Thiohalocapsa sp. TaxID=2497641 RepID=UPI0025DA0419|nr:response regulator [Thiohalocapsa sp.]MCG6943602.1 response regulator [Thiohalocapsa sp.]
MVKRILVIDDDEAIRKVMLLALESTPYQVDTVGSGAEAVDLARSESYDLVYLDLKMPDLNGIESLRALRRVAPDVRVYFMTAYYGDYLDELRALRTEGEHFELIKKPLNMRQIVDYTRAIIDGGGLIGAAKASPDDTPPLLGPA